MLSIKCLKYSGLLFLFLFSTGNIISQNKFTNAFTFNTQVTGDFIYNFKGGIKTGYTYIGMEDFSLEFNTGDAGWWENGTFFIHGLNAHGKGASAFLTGDLQVLSNIEAGDYTGLYEFYFLQEFNRFSFLIGQHDLNSEFIGTKYGGTFINSSFGIAPNVSLNIPVSIYPVAAPCLMVKYNSTKSVIYKLAVYDGDPGNFESNRFNLQWNINANEGLFSIAEIEYNNVLNEQLTGLYKAGIYFHSGEFLNYSDTISYQKGNYGIYAIVDQALFNRSLHTGRGLCFFLQGGLAPGTHNQVGYYAGAGLRYHGIIAGRFYDELGIAVANIGISNAYRNIYKTPKSTETTLEATYKFVFGQKYSIQPSVQYVFNPGAGAYNNCVVSILRFSLEY